MPHRSMGGWQVDVAGHIVGVAGEAGGWGGEKWLGGAGGDGGAAIDGLWPCCVQRIKLIS